MYVCFILPPYNEEHTIQISSIVEILVYKMNHTLSCDSQQRPMEIGDYEHEHNKIKYD